MKKIILLLAAALLIAPAAYAVDVGFDLDLHIANRAPAPIIVHEPPLFLVPAQLGFQVAVGLDFDMFHIDGRFYQCRDGHWYMAPRYYGPWQGVGPKHLPPGLAKKRYAEIIRLRDMEYANYRKDKDRYHGKSYRPERGYQGQNGNGKGNGKGNKKG